MTDLLTDIDTETVEKTDYKYNAPKIDRIYVTRGDNLYDYDGIKCDKFFGLAIKGKIYWMNHTFGTMQQLESQLSTLGVHMNEKGRWGQLKEDGWATLEHSVTRITKHHDDIFTPTTKYLKDAEFFSEGMIWWYLKDLKAKLFPEMP